jgi:hypothetical protein
MSGDEWYQQSLTPPRVLEVNVRIGIIPEEDHAQVLAEMKDPTNGILIAQWSCPHVGVRNLWSALDEAVRRAGVWMADEVDPF